jgi:hypothetical protein
MNGIQQLSFKTKIITVMVVLLLTSTVTSFLSAGYFIQKELSVTDTNRIKSQLLLVSKIVDEKFTSNLLLAKTIQLSISNLGETLHITGFHSLSKVLYGSVFTPDNKVEYSKSKPTPLIKYTDEEQQKYLDIEAKAAGKDIYISELYYEEGKP